MKTVNKLNGRRGGPTPTQPASDLERDSCKKAFIIVQLQLAHMNR